MSRIAFVNGSYAPISSPLVSAEDRGYQFSDGVYEVMLVIDGGMWDDVGHFARLRRSLAALDIAEPASEGAIRAIIRRLLRRNRLKDSLVYLQITRGAASRDHAYAVEAPAPSLVVTARPFSLEKANGVAACGARVITEPDIRWGRVDIKTIGLLPNALAKTKARRAGALECWFHRDGRVTEGASSNAWIVDGEGRLITHPLGNQILGGITRETVIACAEELQMTVVERAFTLEEAFAAEEAFITSATNVVTPVTHIDEHQVKNGAPGPIATRLRAAYVARCAAHAGPV